MTDHLPDDQQALHDRALRNLLRAAQEAGPGELSYAWVAEGDPDFNVLRELADDDWRALLARLAPPTPSSRDKPPPTRAEKPPVPPPSHMIAEDIAALRFRAAEGRAKPRPIAAPESPLGIGLGRRIGWSLAAVVMVLLTGAALGRFIDDPGVLRFVIAFLLLATTPIVLFRAYIVYWERRPVVAAGARDRGAPPPAK